MINTVAKKSSILFVIGLVLFLPSFVNASHNTSRYFPFLERSERYTTLNKSYLNVDAFYISISSAYHRDRGGASIIGLWGDYNLKDVIYSLQAVKGTDFVNPLITLTGTQEFATTDIWFDSHGRARVQGLSLGGTWQPPFSDNFSVGAWIPVMHMSGRGRYTVGRAPQRQNIDNDNNDEDFAALDEFSRESLLFSAAMRQVHDQLGLDENLWSHTGVGDLDLYFSWQNSVDYRFRMKRIIMCAQVGVLIPTGVVADQDVPSSLPFMGNNHWGLYGDVALECELKQDVKVGVIAGLTGQFEHTHTIRIPVRGEPAPFSALKAKVAVRPGLTFKVSPYLTLENLTPGLNIQGRYTYRRHGKDRWFDRRKNPAVESYLLQGFRVCKREHLSSWRSHYFTFELTYDTAVEYNHVPTQPRFHITYDMPIGGRGIADTHQVTIGAQLHF